MSIAEINDIVSQLDIIDYASTEWQEVVKAVRLVVQNNNIMLLTLVFGVGAVIGVLLGKTVIEGVFKTI